MVRVNSAGREGAAALAAVLLLVGATGCNGRSEVGALPETEAESTTPAAVTDRHVVERDLRVLQYVGGHLWATHRGGMSRIDVQAGTVTDRLEFADEPARFVHGAGSLWVTDFSRDVLHRVDPGKAAVGDVFPVARHSEGVAYGAGSVWISNLRSSAVQRLDAATGKVLATVTIGTGTATSHGPQGSRFAFGKLWVAVSFLNAVVAIDPATDTVVSTVQIADGQCAVCGAVASSGEDTPATADDAIWVTGDTSLHRIDPTTEQVSNSVPLGFPANGGAEADLTVSTQGVWVSGSAGRVLLVDSVSGVPLSEVALGTDGFNVAMALAYGGGRVWAYDPSDGSLVAIDPSLVLEAATSRTAEDDST